MARIGSLLGSKITRGVFGRFFVAAFIPISLMAFLSFTHISNLLTEQTQKQLQHASKSYGTSIYERILFLEDSVIKIVYMLSSGHQSTKAFQAPLDTRFNSITIRLQNGEYVPLLGDRNHWPSFSQSESRYLEQGKTVLTSKHYPGRPPELYLSRAVNPNRPEAGVIIAEIKNDYLWGKEENLPFMVNICVLDESNTVLNCFQPIPEPVTKSFESKQNVQTSGDLRWSGDEGNYLAGFWQLKLKPNFHADHWTIISDQAQAHSLIPITRFKTMFIPVAIASLLFVFILTLFQARKSLKPIKEVITGAEHIANQDFSNPVILNSGDEYEQLAMSFNKMATRLDKRFSAMNVLSELDQLILTSPEVEQVLDLVLNKVLDIIKCDVIAVTVIDADSLETARTYIKNYSFSEEHESPVARTVLTAKDVDELLEHTKGFSLGSEAKLRPYLLPIVELGSKSVYTLPVIFEKRLSGIISLGYMELRKFHPSDIGHIRDVADRVGVALSTAARDEELYHQAHYDALTGLPNRQLLKDRLAQEIVHANREKHKVALLFLDLDRFKNVNDTLGHAAGDRLLQETAQRLKSCVREVDTVARLGGDEFTIVLSNILNPREASVVATKIIKSLTQPFHIDNHENFVGTSIGITIYPTDGSTPEELLKNADTAMYRAKESGRGKYMYFEEGMNAEALERTNLERDLRRALERDEFLLYYQPQIDTHTKKITSAEALIRWQHPSRGLVMPDRFIPIAEDTGVIETMGEWALNTACQQFRQWRKEGLTIQRITVNVSIRQFKQLNFVSKVEAALAKASIHPKHLELEITESILMEDVEDTIFILNKLNEMGVHLSIDDFGTGYSSLSYLKRFPIHKLKIDRSFIQDIPIDEDASTIANSIIVMAHTLKKQVVAEGVENTDQLKYLYTNRCDMVQGFLFSRPLPAEKFAEYLRQKKHIRNNAEKKAHKQEQQPQAPVA